MDLDNQLTVPAAPRVRPPVGRSHRRLGPSRYGVSDAARWFGLAVGALAVSGVFSLILVLGRIPATAAVLMPDPLLAQRSLVVHVNLAMGVWFFACIAGLFCLLPGRRHSYRSLVAQGLAVVGVILLIIPTFFNTAEPILSNYVPALDHPVFLLGLALSAAAVMLNFADRRLLAGGAAEADLPPDAQVALRSAAVVFGAAMLTLAGAYVTQPPGMAPADYYERLFWGGGHVLQAANTLGMLAAWLILLHHLTHRATVTQRWARLLLGALVLPTLIGPWLMFGNDDPIWFTRMMQYGLFPAVLVFIALGLRALCHRRSRPADPATPALVGLATSAGMTLAGFFLGALIVADTTLTPAHYHANIGAVTVAYMTVLMVLLPRLGGDLPWPRLARWQPLVYGTGQMLFVLGLAIAGTLGQAPRKVYGPSQYLPGPPERIGLAIVGVGGVLALAGGVLFIAMMMRAAWLAVRAARPACGH